MATGIVASWRPVALLLAAGLLTHHPRAARTDRDRTGRSRAEASETATARPVPRPITPSLRKNRVAKPTNLPNTSCGSTSFASRPPDACQPVWSWIGSRAGVTKLVTEKSGSSHGTSGLASRPRLSKYNPFGARPAAVWGQTAGSITGFRALDRSSGHAAAAAGTGSCQRMAVSGSLNA